MPRLAKNIKYIAIHCTAGHQPAEKVQDFFTRPKSQGGKGWSKGGYHRIIEKDGTIKEMYPFSEVTNGVSGFNLNSIHISYVGGINEELSKQNKYVPEDTRTEAQKCAIEQCVIDALNWLEENGKDDNDTVIVLGHRDFSPDKNGNGRIESWERIKACPCFDAMEEYGPIYSRGTIKIPN